MNSIKYYSTIYLPILASKFFHYNFELSYLFDLQYNFFLLYILLFIFYYNIDY